MEYNTHTGNPQRYNIHISHLCFEVLRKDALIPKYNPGNHTRIPDSACFELGFTSFYDIDNFCQWLETLDEPWVVKKINIFIPENNRLEKQLCLHVTAMLESIQNKFKFEMSVYPMPNNMFNTLYGCGNDL